VLAAAPTPTQAASLTTARLRRLLRHAGRQRNLDAWTKRLRASFHADPPRQLPLVEQAMGQQVQALVKQLEAALKAADDPWPRPPPRSSVATPTTRSSPASPAWGS
jgi:hypothetical protein